jgi:hypothetical protein
MTRTRAVGLRARPPLFVAIAVAGTALLAALLAAGCRDTTPSRTRTDDAPVSATTPLSEVVRRRAPELMAIPGVVGVAEAALPDGSPCLRVYVVQRTPALNQAIPRVLDGWPVDVEESGEFRAMGDTAKAP